ncbi:glutamate mutase L [Nocardioides sp. TF02-7]|uniref:glutamate mutase L n=1 Tax=Nocardioides sp. TF02-7 TaxID=2917724 RepID=UPI001F057C32|nr:glutamate mutase L [Nocardioides sp. TF02-7]UMG91488.1 glutamate mutase L [Nocardioides sp. TF02-7]
MTGARAAAGGAVLCVDVGSTFTKALLVDLAEARIVARADRPTFGTGDVMDAIDGCRADLAATDPRAEQAEVLACSSAGGALWIAVVGNEELVTAEAGRRVALSSGGRVTAVVALAGREHAAVVAQLAGLTRPARDRSEVDVVLLTGGTDGGNAEALLAGARALVDAGWTGPTVVSGNVEAYDEVARVLAGRPHVLADNVVPRIGVLAPDGARSAIREAFLRHVIGGKGLSRGSEFAALVRGATPDVVLTGVELLAHGLDEQHPGAGDVAVVDVGGATTDVYSVLTVDPELSEAGGLAREVVAPTSANRTVEADLGMRWSARGVLEAVGDAASPGLREAVARLTAAPGSVPADDAAYDVDEELARIAATTAVRRHAGRSRVVLAPDGRVVERTGVDLREVALLVGSGGVLRHGRPGAADRVLGSLVTTGDPEGWQLPERARVVVDDDYRLMAVGLLAGPHPEVAHRLAAGLGSKVAP